jgi:hypothetical protein
VRSCCRSQLLFSYHKAYLQLATAGAAQQHRDSGHFEREAAAARAGAMVEPSAIGDNEDVDDFMVRACVLNGLMEQVPVQQLSGHRRRRACLRAGASSRSRSRNVCLILVQELRVLNCEEQELMRAHKTVLHSGTLFDPRKHAESYRGKRLDVKRKYPTMQQLPDQLKQVAEAGANASAALCNNTVAVYNTADDTAVAAAAAAGAAGGGAAGGGAASGAAAGAAAASATDGGAGRVNKRQRHLTKEATDILTRWFVENQAKPYPSSEEKKRLCASTGLSATQIRNWFTNMRKRHWAPVKNGREPRSFVDYVLQVSAPGTPVATHG